MLGLTPELGLQPALAFLVMLAPDGFVVFHLVFHYRIKDAGYFMRRGYDPGFAAQFGFHAPQVRAHLVLAVVQGISGLAEKLSGPVVHLPHADPYHSASGLVVVRT